jgi:glycosyltransferase involved in cell wall biosynthesis
VVSATYHHRHHGQLWAYAPYARELAVWADLVPNLMVIAPEVDSPPPADTAPIDRTNVELLPLPATGGESVAAKLRQIVAIPRLLILLWRGLRGVDAVHVRAPGNTALLGLLVAPLRSRRLVAKYAGQWVGYPEEPLTVRFQRAVLRSRWWSGPVTVYGDWPDQPAKVVPFFTSVLDRAQVERAGEVASRRTPGEELHVLFVGRLTAPKRAVALVEALATLVEEGRAVRATIVGDGPERPSLEAAARRLGVEDRLDFRGAIPFDDVLDTYATADVLVLVSESEGWPKAIAEAMAFGVVCIGSDRGLVPWMLGDERGLVVPPGDADGLAEALRSLADDPGRRAAMAANAAAWAHPYSLEGLGDAVRELLEDRWGARLGGPAAPVRVLHITDTLDAGGAERVAVNLVNALPRDRYRPSLCSTRHEGPLAADVAADVRRLALGRRRRPGDVRAAHRLARFIREEQVDLVHAHGTSVFIASAAALLEPVPLIWHDHLGGGPEVRTRHLRLYRTVARRAQLVLTVNWDLARWAVESLGLPAARVRRLPNFVVQLPAGAPAPALPGTAGSRIVCVANLRPHKDHRTLVQAMAVVHAARPDAHLLLAGAPTDPAVVRDLAEEIRRLDLEGSVSMLGSRADVAALLEGCDVGVLSSWSEGFPLALLEYAASGLPVVAADVGDCAEILQDGALGRLVPARQPERLAAEIIDLLEHPADSKELGAALQASIPGRYDRDEVLAGVIDAYDHVLSRVEL